MLWERSPASASSAKSKNRIAGMLDVGKDIVSHFKQSDLSTKALREQQREINPCNDETEKGDSNVVEKQTSAGVLSDCRLLIQKIATVGTTSPT